MKKTKKLFALALCLMLVVLTFAGCSKAGKAEEITDETLIIAYRAENAPFIYTDENGELTGFDVELMETIFSDIKNDYKNYAFVLVDEDYRLGEDGAYVDDEGNAYPSYLEVGGLAKNTGTFNEDYSMSNTVIENKVITVTAAGSAIKSYADLAGATVGVVSDVARAGLDKNAAVKNSLAAVNNYTDLATAINDLNAGTIDAIVVDEFTYYAGGADETLTVLEGMLDDIEYVYGFKKFDWYKDSINTAIMELQDPEYNGADEFTPIVEKYFGYDASNFEYSAK